MDLLAVQGTLKSLLQHHSSKASILLCSAFFIVQLSHPYMTTGKTISLIRQTFVGKVMTLLFNMQSRLVITFLPGSKCLLISWLQSPSAVILQPKNIKSLTVSTVSPSICHAITAKSLQSIIIQIYKITQFNEIKRRLLLGRKVMTNPRQHIQKQRHYFVNKDPSSQGYGFSSGHV